jgi:hypothetical protein
MIVRCDEGSDLWKAVQAAKDAEPRSHGGGTGLSAGVLAVAQARALEEAVQAECDKLVPMDGTVAGSVTLGLFRADGRGCSAIVHRWHPNGSASVWHVQAYAQPGLPASQCISVRVSGPWTDNDDARWEKHIAELAKGREGVVIENHCWFSVGDEAAKGMRGFGGYRFEFQPLDGGPVLVSTNMWFGGAIPPAFRDRIPDTHKMLKGFYPGPVA